MLPKYRIQRKTVSVILAFAVDNDGAVTADVDLNGILERVAFTVPDLDSTHTASLTITNSRGITVYSDTAVAESSTADESASSRAVEGKHTFTIATSGAQTANRTFTIELLLDRG